ncbi:MAG: hypothetical protein EBY06_03585, partial [Burkholderiaceae bacterium]|nr:hypothetical protein [Burkholderiaceae bacterium]
MNPASPDRAIQQAFHEAEGALARIAHVNRLSRDIMDVKFYELDLDNTTTLRISSKKGIVELVNADPLVTTISIGLQND